MEGGENGLVFRKVSVVWTLTQKETKQKKKKKKGVAYLKILQDFSMNYVWLTMLSYVSFLIFDN